MAAPLMTWAQTPLQVFPTPITTVSDFFTKLAAHVTAYSTYWQTSILDPAVSKRYYEFKRKGTIAAVMTNFRGFLCGDASSGPPNANMLTPHNSTTSPGNLVYASFAPNVGGTYPNTGLDTKWLSGLPYAGDSNNGGLGGYFRCTDNGISSVDAMWLLECEDILCVVLMRRSDQATWFFQMGGLIQGPSVSLGDPVRGDEIIWGACTTGAHGLGAAPTGKWLWGEGVNGTSARANGVVNGQLCDSGERYRQGMIWAIEPAGRTLTTGTATRVLKIWGPQQSIWNWADGSDPNHQGFYATTLTPNGAIVGDPMVYNRAGGGTRIGSLRQMRMYFQGLSRKAIANSSGTVKGFLLAPNYTFTDYQAMLFSQELNPGVG